MQTVKAAKSGRPPRNRLLVFVETMGAQIVGALLSVVNIAVATHALSRSEAGSFFVVIGIAVIGGTLGSLGFTSASAVLLGKALAANEVAKVRGAIESMLVILVAANVGLAGLLVGASQSTLAMHMIGVSLPRSYVVPVLLQLVGIALSQASPSISLALGHARKTAWLRYAIPNILILVFLLASHWIFPIALETVLWCYALGFLINGLISTSHAALAAIRLSPRSEKPKVREVLTISLPLTITQLQVNLIDYGILWTAASVMPLSDVALLGMAQRVASGSQIAFRSSVLLYMPTAARMFSRGEQAGLRTLSKVTGFLTAAPSLLLLAATVIFGRGILGLVFGARYAETWVPLALLFAGFSARGLAGPGEYLLQITGRHYVVVVGNMIYLVAMMIATYATGAHWGTTGVAAIIATCTSIQQGVYLLLCRRWYGFSVGATFRYSEVKRGLIEIKM